jgi:hypothetical protein
VACRHYPSEAHLLATHFSIAAPTRARDHPTLADTNM